MLHEAQNNVREGYMPYGKVVRYMCGGNCTCGHKRIWDTEFDFTSDDVDTPKN